MASKQPLYTALGYVTWQLIKRKITRALAADARRRRRRRAALAVVVLGSAGAGAYALSKPPPRGQSS